MNDEQRDKIRSARKRYDDRMEMLEQDEVFALSQVLGLPEEEVRQTWDDAV